MICVDAQLARAETVLAVLLSSRKPALTNATKSSDLIRGVRVGKVYAATRAPMPLGDLCSLKKGGHAYLQATTGALVHASVSWAKESEIFALVVGSTCLRDLDTGRTALPTSFSLLLSVHHFESCLPDAERLVLRRLRIAPGGESRFAKRDRILNSLLPVL